MNILSNSVPVWVSIAFIFTFPIFIFMIANTAKQAAIRANFTPKKAQNIYRSIVGFGLGYFIYVALMSILTDMFKENVLPPRILLFTALPLMLFYILYVSRTKTYKTLLEHATLPELIRLHTFRFIGVFFLITASYGALPKGFALAGGIGDIFAAVTAIFVANMVKKQHKHSRIAAFAWNCIGTLDILNVVLSAIITTKLSLEVGSQNLMDMGNFPFSWIAAFAPATILFLHFGIFKKWRTVYNHHEKLGLASA